MALKCVVTFRKKNFQSLKACVLCFEVVSFLLFDWIGIQLKKRYLWFSSNALKQRPWSLSKGKFSLVFKSSAKRKESCRTNKSSSPVEEWNMKGGLGIYFSILKVHLCFLFWLNENPAQFGNSSSASFTMAGYNLWISMMQRDYCKSLIALKSSQPYATHSWCVWVACFVFIIKWHAAYHQNAKTELSLLERLHGFNGVILVGKKSRNLTVSIWWTRPSDLRPSRVTYFL